MPKREPFGRLILKIGSIIGAAMFAAAWLAMWMIRWQAFQQPAIPVGIYEHRHRIGSGIYYLTDWQDGVYSVALLTRRSPRSGAMSAGACQSSWAVRARATV